MIDQIKCKKCGQPGKVVCLDECYYARCTNCTGWAQPKTMRSEFGTFTINHQNKGGNNAILFGCKIPLLVVECCA